MTPSQKITKIIIETPTENRGNLLVNIAKELKKQSQGYTSSLFLKIAVEYGIKELTESK